MIIHSGCDCVHKLFVAPRLGAAGQGEEHKGCAHAHTRARTELAFTPALTWSRSHLGSHAAQSADCLTSGIDVLSRL